MGHTWKIESHLENGFYLEKWFNLGKLGQSWKNGSQLEKGLH